MMATSIFDFDSYKKFLRAYFVDGRKQMPGQINLAELARKTGYQRSFFSRVINAELHLTPEGVYKIAQALGFAENEREYLFWLVEKERAGDTSYRVYAKARAADLKRDAEASTKAAAAPIQTEAAYFSSYLSSWMWVAIHLATAVPVLQTASAIADRYALPIPVVMHILRTLVELGLVRVEGTQYVFHKGSMHIAENSPWVQLHHSNWRQRALTDAQLVKPDAIHFTNILTLSESDRELAREEILKAIQRVMKIAQPSPAEDVVGFNLDFFRV